MTMKLVINKLKARKQIVAFLYCFWPSGNKNEDNAATCVSEENAKRRRDKIKEQGCLTRHGTACH